MINIIGYADGSCKTNPGPATCGYFWTGYSDNYITKIIEVEGGKRLDLPGTNNEAEYAGFFALIRSVIYNDLVDGMGIGQFKIFMDSNLVVQQINGKWKCNAQHLKDSVSKGQELRKIMKFELDWIKRDCNSDADEMAEEAYSGDFERIKLW